MNLKERERARTVIGDVYFGILANAPEICTSSQLVGKNWREQQNFNSLALRLKTKHIFKPKQTLEKTRVQTICLKEVPFLFLGPKKVPEKHLKGFRKFSLKG